MADPITDSTIAQTLIENALANTTPPALGDGQIALLVSLAESTGADGNPAYTGADLNRAVAIGWNWKAALVSDQYTLAGGSGKQLNRSEWFNHCLTMAGQYGAGVMSVLDGGAGTAGTRPSGIRSIGLVGSSVDPVTLDPTAVS